jgi:hypothetical protein
MMQARHALTRTLGAFKTSMLQVHHAASNRCV